MSNKIKEQCCMAVKLITTYNLNAVAHGLFICLVFYVTPSTLSVTLSR